MPRSYVLGLQAKLSYKNSGTTKVSFAADAATLVETGNVRDLTLNLETAEADITTRSAVGWRQVVGTLKDGSVDFEMIWDPTDLAFIQFMTAWLNTTTIPVAVLDHVDAPPTGERVIGLYADFAVVNFSRSEPLEDALKASVRLRIGRAPTAPEWVNILTP